MTTIMMTWLVSSSPYAFGAQPDPGFLNNELCDVGGPGGKQFDTTCCWKETDEEGIEID